MLFILILIFILLLSVLLTYLRVKQIIVAQKELNAEICLFPYPLKYSAKNDFLYSFLKDNEGGYIPVLDDYSRFFGNSVNFLHIKFTYYGKNYIILIKKGMFGCFLGAYINLFVKENIKNNLLTTYKQEDLSLLFKNVKFTLLKNKTEILKSNLKSFCNGYKIYKYIKPENLVLKCSLTCKNRDIKTSLVIALENLNISFKTVFNKIIITFKDFPKSESGFKDLTDEKLNEALSKYYILKFVTYNQKGTLNKLMYLKEKNKKFYTDILQNILKSNNKI